MPISIDTEATYSKERGIQTLGVTQYVRHPETDHYMVSLYGPNWAWVGHPERVPWKRLEGETLISHNAAYDKQVLAELHRRGVAPRLTNAWHCSADLAAYCQSPRSLKDSCRELLGIEIDKGTRDKMKGKQVADMGDGFMEEVAQYALYDAKACWMLWDQFSSRWPEHEVQLSDHTALMCARGIGVDVERVEEGISKLRLERAKCERAIPWADKEDAAITSPKEIALHCRAIGIEPPVSTDAKSEEFDLWTERYAGQVDFVRAIQRWRSVNRTLQILEAINVRQVDGTLSYSLKYAGSSHTLRWAGDNRLNVQNFPRKPVADVDVRSMFIPRNGNKLIGADLAQIEARVLLWLVQDSAMLDALLMGQDLYETYARKALGYSDPRPLKEVNNDLRQLSKVMVLQLGFGSGAKKFAQTHLRWTGKELDESRAKQLVADFRKRNPKITQLWKQLERACNSSRGGSFYCELPSGRTIEYFDVARIDGQTTGRVERGEYRKNLYGGMLTENLCQATARDIIAEAILRLERAGFPVVLHVHDEIVCEAPAEALPEIERLMMQPPEWAEGLPIEVEAKALDRYSK